MIVTRGNRYIALKKMKDSADSIDFALVCSVSEALNGSGGYSHADFGPDLKGEKTWRTRAKDVVTDVYSMCST
jgi:hypothetical protein